MFYTIYKITNVINNKHYIGMHKTKDINDGYMGSGKLLKRAINKYGMDNFTKEILFVFDNENDMKNKEKELVVICSESYNLCEGGKGGFGFINDHGLSNTKLGRQKADEVLKQKYGNNFSCNPKGNIKALEEYWKDKDRALYKSFLGKKHTEETKQKMRIANKQQGSKNSQYGSMWITNGIDNKKIKKDLDTIPEGWYKGRNKMGR